jgi:DNA invertase Pin-like site-specific DNA recombinase
MRVVIAARLSQLADGQTGLDTQDLESVKWAEVNGHTVVYIAKDRKSGTTHPSERPDLRPWITDPEKLAQYDALLALKLDRLSRGDNASTSAIEEWARKHGKQLLTADGLYFPCEGTDGIRWDVTKRIAHQEWLATSERYRRMQGYLRDNGKLVGRPPFGYTVVCAEPCDVNSSVCKTHHKTLEPTDEGREYVPQIFKRVADGESLAKICRWLDSEGVSPNSKTGKYWSPKSVAQMIRNPTYRGSRQDAEGRTILEVESLVDALLWRRAGKRLSNAPRGRRSPRSGKPSLLTGILYCARCEAPMYRINGGTTRKDGSKNRLFYYRCAGKLPNRTGCGNMINLDALDVLATNMLASADAPWTELRTVPGNNHDGELEAIKYAIRDLAARDLSDDEFDAELAELRSERKRLEALPATADRTETVETGETVGQRWTRLDRDGRRTMMRESVKFYADSIEVDDAGRVPTLRIESRLFTLPLVSDG